MNTWKVLCTRSGFEFKVEEQLSRLGIENYLPKIKITRQWSDRKKIVTAPAFPRYIFVHTDDKRRNEVFYVKGVLQYIKIDNKDASLENEDIEMIRIAETSITDPQSLSGFVKKGSRVKIVEGALTGYSGELIDFMGKQKIVLLIKELAAGFLVEIPVSQIRLI
ncbi:MAG: UpxY family transcription antiterminator [Saprospiraceae bacterium]